MSEPSLDGSLKDWPAIANQFAGSALLLGNGLSINLWPAFDYGSLYEHAQSGGLTSKDVLLFEGTPNFERVLADLNTAIRINKAVGIDPGAVLEPYRRIQKALGHAVREVHVSRSSVPDEALLAIRQELVNYEWIFTTSYDLIIYWAMGCGGSWKPFIDGFRFGGHLAFDPERAVVAADQLPVYFLHGALHLVVGGSGVTRKLRTEAVQTILDQFGEPIAGDPLARPLLVTEGSSHDKLRAIEGNAYLAHALEQLRRVELPIVVFGSSLGAHDQHLIDAINERPKRPVAVSMVRRPKRELMSLQADIYGRLQAETLVFFDATTHPLGAPGLRVP
jgi:hypothetical protein